METFEAGLAALSASVYEAGRSLANLAPLPVGAIFLKHFRDDDTGFEASAYRYQGHIVISYAGTLPGAVDGITDLKIGIGVNDDQLRQSALFYEGIKKDYGSDIVFTGHSLGGGLAALMGLFFDKQAVTFDPAPFRLSATNSMADAIDRYLQKNGITDSDIAGFSAVEQSLAAARPDLIPTMLAAGLISPALALYLAQADYPTSIPREVNITAYATQGEILSVGVGPTVGPVQMDELRIRNGSVQFIENGGPGTIASGESSALHSMPLLTLFLMKSDLAPLTLRLPKLISELLDDKLYARAMDSSQQDILIRLLRNQLSNEAVSSSVDVLDNFIADLGKLVDGGGVGGPQGMREALSVAAMEYYYFKDPLDATGLFTVSGGGLNFKYSDIGGPQYKSLPMLASAIAADTADLISSQEQWITPLLRGKNAWHIDLAGQALNWTAAAGDAQNDAALGGVLSDVMDGGAGADILIGDLGIDTLTGGSGNDILLGGFGNDILSGGTDNDFLDGGVGNDTYKFAQGGGFDTIQDSDGEGKIVYGDGNAVAAGDRIGQNMWKSADGLLTIERSQLNEAGFYTLTIRDASGSEVITINNWLNTELGITLDNSAPIQPPTLPMTGGPIVGDLEIRDFDPDTEGVQPHLDGLGNRINTGVAKSIQDDLNGSGNNDTMIGGDGGDILQGKAGNDILFAAGQVDIGAAIAGGAAGDGNPDLINMSGIANNDFLSGNGGDDILVGSSGADLLSGGAGKDLLVGGQGDDFLDGDSEIDVETFDWSFRWTFTGTDTGSSILYELTGDAALMNLFAAGGDDDVIHAGGGDDVVLAGVGNDVVFGDDGADTLYGEAGRDTLFGGDGNDYIAGDKGWADTNNPANDASDFIDGGAGNDSLYGDGGADVVLGGAGDDQIFGDRDDSHSGSDHLDGEDGNDTIIGGGGEDNILGGAGNDTLIGDASDVATDKQGADYLDGGDGADLLIGGGRADTLIGGAGADQLYGDSADTDPSILGDDYLDGGDGNDTLVGGGGADTLIGGTGDDQLFGDSSDTPAGKSGDDYLEGGAGKDLLVGSGGSDTLFGGDGDDQLAGDSTDTAADEQGDDFIDGGAGNDVLQGYGGSDTLLGDDGDDVLVGDGGGTPADKNGDDNLDGGAGNDQLFGGGGNDSLSGGDGADQLYGDSADTSADQLGDDFLDGGAGNDTLVGAGGNDTLSGGAGDDSLFGDSSDTAVEKQGDDVIDGGSGDDVLRGYGGNDVLSGDDGDDLLIADQGNDVLDGGIGVDELQGGDGADVLRGGADDDRLFGEAGNDVLDGGVGEDVLVGGEGDDVIDGGEGNDLIQGGAGNDVLTGGAGLDLFVYHLGDGEDHIVDSGNNTVQFEFSFFGSGLVLGLGSLELNFTSHPGDSLHLDGFDPNDPYNSAAAGTFQFTDITLSYADLLALGIDFTGTPDGDLLTGTNANDNILGLANADTLIGRAGDDLLDGGTGADAMSGGAGNDTYIVDDAGDVVTEIGDEGTDLVKASITYTLTSNVENLTLTGSSAINGTGNALDNVITGTDSANTLGGLTGNDTLNGAGGNDRLIGGAGNDTLIGGAGDDTYVVDSPNDDTIIELAGEGTDNVESSSNYALSANIENLTLTGTADTSGTGNAANNVITGNAGNNTLDGQGGADTLQGGAGNDSYIVDAADTVIEAAGAGIDTILAGISYTLSANVESLTLIGTLAIDGTGNELANVITGNSTANTLDGRAGADTLIGGAGNDTYIVDNAGDIIIETAADETDILRSSATYIIAAGVRVEDAYLIGTQAVNMTGNGLQNSITGNSADNVISGASTNGASYFGGGGNDTLIGGGAADILDGGVGVDRMEGGDGADIYYVNVSNDVVIEALNSGYDVVEASSTYTLADNVERLNLAEDAGDTNGTGNALDNAIYGNIGNNTLYGGGGNDEIFASDGNDTVDGGDGDDILDAGSGNDVLEGGAGNDVLRGVTGDNQLSGGAGEDTLYGGDGRDTLLGGADDDVLDGGAGADTLYGGDGNDALSSGGGSGDSLYGEAGNDTLEGDGLLDGGSGDDLIEGSGTLIGGGGNDTLHGQGFDVLRGGAGDDVLVAYSNPFVQGPNVLEGGTGNDTIYGSFGQDTYAFNLGDGRDLVIERRPGEDYSNIAPTSDTLQFGAGIVASDLSFHRRGNDLVIEHVNGTDAITAQNWFSGSTDHFKLDSFTFADGSTLSQAQVENQVIWHGTAGVDSFIGYRALNETMLLGDGNDQAWGRGGNDKIYGEAGDDYLEGEDGNDTVDGGAGADQLRGGVGNDQLVGGTGDDKYVYDLGGGVDTIDNTGGGYDGVFFIGGITAERLSFSRDGNDLLIKVDGSAANSVRVAGHFLGGDKAISYVQPDGGFLLDAAHINHIIAAQGVPGNFATLIDGTAAGEQLVGYDTRDLLRGQGGNDTLFGMSGNDQLEGGDGNDYLSGGDGSRSGSGDDVLIGGAGNDTLFGEDGADTLTGGTGDDAYYYSAGGGVDVVDNTGGGFDGAFFLDIARSRLSFHRDGNDLVILVDGDLAQQLRINGHFLGGDLAVDYVQPGDGGSAYTTAQIAAMLTALPGGGGNPGGGDPGGGDPGGGGTPPTPGLGGDDVITGTVGNDTLLGGAGNDTLNGAAGNDRLIGGEGNDTYTYTAGQDVIEEVGTGTDTLVFANGITFSQVSSGLVKSGNDLLLRVNGSTTNQVTLKDFFLGGGNLVETVTFQSGGQQLTAAQIFSAFGLTIPTPGAAFDATTQGSSGDDTALNGTAQRDLLQGFNGNDTLFGDAGVDRLEGGNGNDSLKGGTGNDTLLGGRGDDTYIFASGDGQDVIDNSGGGNDTLRFEGITFSQISSGLTKSGNDLILIVSGGSDRVTFKNWFLGGDNVVDTLTFVSGGQQLTAAQIFSAFGVSNPDPNGSPAYLHMPDERAFGTILAGQAGAQIVFGSSDADQIDGGAGNDTIRGNHGNDYLLGGDGNDIYQFAAGDGADVINNLSNAPSADNDALSIEGIARENLWLSRHNDDLVIDVLGGSTDAITIQDWYANAGQMLDSIQAGSSTLLASSVNTLVTAMAAFGAPTGGEINLTQAQRDQVNAIIAANWQSGSLSLLDASNNLDDTVSPGGGAEASGLTSWALSDSLASFHLNATDTEAFGGDLTHRYGGDESAADISVISAIGVLGDGKPLRYHARAGAASL